MWYVVAATLGSLVGSMLVILVGSFFGTGSYDEGYSEGWEDAQNAVQTVPGGGWVTALSSPVATSSYYITPESLHIEPDESA